MPVATRPRLFSSRLLPLLVVFAGFVSGCQSSRPSFSFQPAPYRQVAQAEISGREAPPQYSVATAVGMASAPALLPPVPHRHNQARQRAQAARLAWAAKTILVPKTACVALHRRTALLHRPHATAEAGLGTTVFGVLGLVVLPIALVGLAISGGGMVWAIVAGAAALAVLVAYLDPFGR